MIFYLNLKTIEEVVGVLENIYGYFLLQKEKIPSDAIPSCLSKNIFHYSDESFLMKHTEPTNLIAECVFLSITLWPLIFSKKNVYATIQKHVSRFGRSVHRYIEN